MADATLGPAPASLIQQFTLDGTWQEVEWTGAARAMTVNTDDGAGAKAASDIEVAFVVAPGNHTMDVLAAKQPFSFTLPRTQLGGGPTGGQAGYDQPSSDLASVFIKGTNTHLCSVWLHD